jgi:hypothetical protein
MAMDREAKVIDQARGEEQTEHWLAQRITQDAQ